MPYSAMRSSVASVWVLAVWLILAGLGLERSRPSAPSSPSSSYGSAQQMRSEMLEALEDLVQRERFYRRRTGVFTDVVGKLEFQVPSTIRSEVEVRVTRADREHLLVEAFREGGRDRVWMDEDFRVRASFPLGGLRWVVVEQGQAEVGSDSALPALEIEPVGSTAAAGLTTE